MADLPPPAGSGTPEGPPDPRVGTILGERYRLNRLLGKGGMGRVYAAEHVLMHKRLAVKVLHRELTEVPEVVARFEREAMAAANIDHPNVAAATDFGKLPDGAVFLVLEYLEGRSLREAISEGPMPTARVLHIIRQISSTLAAAHALDVVHRDLKPENVMLVEKGSDPDFVKVLDFGIAKVPFGDVSERGSLRPGEKITKAGMVFGTPEYMAPEQALGQAVDGKADLYALGVMAFEMLAGVRPFVSATQVGILGQQLSFPVPRVSDRAPNVNVPPQVELLVQKLLQKEAANRYATAQEVVGSIDQLRSGVSGRARHLFTLAGGSSPTAGEVLSQRAAPGPVPAPKLPPPPRPPPPKAAPVAEPAEPTNVPRSREKLEASELIASLARSSSGGSPEAPADATGRQQSILDLSESSGLTEISEQREIQPEAKEGSPVGPIATERESLLARARRFGELVVRPARTLLDGARGRVMPLLDRFESKLRRTGPGLNLGVTEPLGSKEGEAPSSAFGRAASRARRWIGAVPGPVLAIGALVALGLVTYAVMTLVAGSETSSPSVASKPGENARMVPGTPATKPVPLVLPSQAPHDKVEAARAAGTSGLKALALEYPSDAELQLLLAKALRKEGQFGQLVDALTRALATDPALRDNGEVATLLWQAVQKRESRQKAFSLLEGSMGPKGADIAYDLVTTKNMQAPVKRQAEELLDKPSVRTAASPGLKVALALREAQSCEARKALLDRARTLGDTRSAAVLETWRQADCLKGDPRLEPAIVATRGRKRH